MTEAEHEAVAISAALFVASDPFTYGRFCDWLVTAAPSSCKAMRGVSREQFAEIAARMAANTARPKRRGR